MKKLHVSLKNWLNTKMEYALLFSVLYILVQCLKNWFYSNIKFAVTCRWEMLYQIPIKLDFLFCHTQQNTYRMSSIWSFNPKCFSLMKIVQITAGISYQMCLLYRKTFSSRVANFSICYCFCNPYINILAILFINSCSEIILSLYTQ